MENNDFGWLAVIIIVIAGSVWMVTNDNFPIKQGLDLQGGVASSVGS